MRVMSAGDGYKYLLRSVAAADGDRLLSTPLTRYYAEEGTPQGSKSSRVRDGVMSRFQSTVGERETVSMRSLHQALGTCA